MSEPGVEKKRRSGLKIALGLLLLFGTPVAVILLLPSGDPGYTFTHGVRRIDMMTDATGRWSYYSPDSEMGNVPTLAAAVRNELVPLGYLEDTASKPWVRFVKGEREVIVCNHNEIATMPTSLIGVNVIHQKPQPPLEQWIVLWVHEPNSNSLGVTLFKIKKYAFGY